MGNPRVSIGVPVYNGQKYIRFTLDSLLAQTCADIEILVTDNCSTDSTPQIVQEYVQRDPRVVYIRNQTNLGPALNYRVSVERARGEYFKWNPADDVCDPRFVEQCLKVLDSDPSVVLAYPRTRIIDTEGKVIGQYTYEIDVADPSPALRLRRIMRVNHRLHGAHEMYGLMRLSELRKTPCMRPHVRGDSILLARLAMLGRFQRVDEFLFYNRDHTDRSSKCLPQQAVRPGSRLARYIGCGPLPSAQWWDPALKGRIVFPEFTVFREYLRAVRETPLPHRSRWACYAVLGLFLIRHLPKLGRDVVIGFEQLINRSLGTGKDPKAPKTGRIAA